MSQPPSAGRCKLRVLQDLCCGDLCCRTPSLKTEVDGCPKSRSCPDKPSMCIADCRALLLRARVRLRDISTSSSTPTSPRPARCIGMALDTNNAEHRDQLGSAGDSILCSAAGHPRWRPRFDGCPMHERCSALLRDVTAGCYRTPLGLKAEVDGCPVHECTRARRK